MPYYVNPLGAPDKYTYLVQWDNPEAYRISKYLGLGIPLPPELHHCRPNELWIAPKGPHSESALPPDMFGPFAYLFVSQRLKSLVEALDPVEHTFVPIRMRWARLSDKFRSPPEELYEVVQAPYFILIINQPIDCVIESKVTLLRTKSSIAGAADHVQVRAFSDHVLDEASIIGRHLWRSAVGNGELTFSYIYCSDNFRNAVKSEKLKYWAFKKAKLGQRP